MFGTSSTEGNMQAQYEPRCGGYNIVNMTNDEGCCPNVFRHYLGGWALLDDQDGPRYTTRSEAARAALRSGFRFDA
jgi:hypothetical protein